MQGAVPGARGAAVLAGGRGALDRVMDGGGLELLDDEFHVGPFWFTVGEMHRVIPACVAGHRTQRHRSFPRTLTGPTSHARTSAHAQHVTRA